MARGILSLSMETPYTETKPLPCMLLMTQYQMSQTVTSAVFMDGGDLGCPPGLQGLGG